MTIHKNHPTAETLLAAKKQYLVPCIYHFYKNPPVLVKDEDVWLIDWDGKRYLDCYSGVTVMSAGHAHPAPPELSCANVLTRVKQQSS